MGFLLLVPFLLLRFGLLALLGGDATRRAAYFAPMLPKEKPAYWVYLFSNFAIFIYPFFLQIHFLPRGLFWAGLGVYIPGAVLLAAALVNFAAPAKNGFNQTGLYKYSRNPMYLAYNLFFLGCALLTQSLLLLAFVLVFALSCHWVILAEERWCLEQFGDGYRAYMQTVRRYL